MYTCMLYIQYINMCVCQIFGLSVDPGEVGTAAAHSSNVPQ